MIKEYSFIKLFRAVAAFWVLAAHCMIWGGWHGIPLPVGKIAVDLFMMISGYLMAANAHARSGFEPLSQPRNWVRFWLRRYFRLAPAYYLSLAAAVLLSYYFLRGYQALEQLNPAHWAHTVIYDPARIQYSFKNIFLHLSFLFGLHPTYAFSTFLPDWSLGLEMQFYFIFPFLLLFMQKRGFVSSAMLIGALTIPLGFAINRKVIYYEPSLIFFKLQYFLAGILLFRALSLGGASLRRNWRLIACAIVLVSVEYRYGKELVVLPILLLSMAYLGRLETAAQMPSWLTSIINGRIVSFSSDVSYGVYLFHGFFISASGLIISNSPKLLALHPPQRVLVMFLFVLAMTYLTAYAVFRLVELPGIQLGKSCLRRVPPINTSLLAQTSRSPVSQVS